MKYFKNINSLEDLESQFKSLLKKNHPDNGGDEEVMKQINVEYDALFIIYKNRTEKEIGRKVNETSSSTRRKFYTEFGWEGSRYNGNMPTTEIAKAIRVYCKEMYPTWKFSVTSKVFSGGSDILICVMEAPQDIFDREYFNRPFSDDWNCTYSSVYRHDCWTNFDKMTEENSYYMQLHSMNGNRDRYDFLNDIGYEVLKDVYFFMQSYNYDDSDSMIDYFSVNFYSGIYIGKWDKGFKIVPKTARIKNKSGEVASTKKAADKDSNEAEKPLEIADNEKPQEITYTIKKGEDTRDGSELWIVKINENLEKGQYISQKMKMKKLGGYYSKFKHGFIFREDPTSKLNIA